MFRNRRPRPTTSSIRSARFTSRHRHAMETEVMIARRSKFLLNANNSVEFWANMSNQNRKLVVFEQNFGHL
jgi:hypothetical protein